jgi:uncharacterized membrane protein
LSTILHNEDTTIFIDLIKNARTLSQSLQAFALMVLVTLSCLCIMILIFVLNIKNKIFLFLNFFSFNYY